MRRINNYLEKKHIEKAPYIYQNLSLEKKKKFREKYFPYEDLHIYGIKEFNLDCELSLNNYQNFKKKIAVHLHLYYLDLLDEFIIYLHKIPYEFNLYVSIPNHIEKKPLLNQLFNITNVNKIFIKHVDNNGRDVAPMLNVFNKELIKYDYLLHIHTKKTLWAGKEHKEWRYHLLNSLLANEKLIKDILNLMENNSNIGMIIPEDYEITPYWCHTPLRNKPFLKDLCHKFNMNYDSYFTNQYIPMSAGTMFWCQPKAIKQIFETKLDFGIEKGLSDGTLAHAIERIFCPLANFNSYDFATIDLYHLKIKINEQNKNLDKYFGLNKNNIRDLIYQYDVITLDIYNTLINFNYYNQNNVFQLITNDDLFINLRKQYNHYNDIDLIYKKLEPYFDLETLNNYKQKEIDYYVNLAISRNDMLNLFNDLINQKKKVILIDDSFLPIDITKTILEKCGYNNTSCDATIDIIKTKNKEETWKSFFENNDLKTIHIGDDEHYDTQILAEINKSECHVMHSKNMFSINNSILSYDLETELILGLIINKYLYNSPFFNNKQEINNELILNDLNKLYPNFNFNEKTINDLIKGVN